MSKNNIILKRLVDILLLVSLLLLLEFPLKRTYLHEIFAVVFIVAVLLHLYLNRKWFKNVLERKGIYNILQAIIVTLLLILLILLLYSGMRNSTDLFGFFDFGSAEVTRRMHLIVSYWFLVLVSIHLGLNWSAFIPANLRARFKESKLRPYLMTLFFAFALYGALVFNGAGIASYMFGLKSFADYGYYDNPVLTFINNLSIVVLFVFLSIQISLFLKRSK